MSIYTTSRWATQFPRPSRRAFSVCMRLCSASTSDSSPSASSIAASLLSRFKAQGPQSRTQILDANQLQLLSLTLNRPSLFPNTPIRSSTPLPNHTPLPPGYHLAYFTPAFLENELGPDGTDVSYNPPAPFTRRMWAGGELHWPRIRGALPNPLRVGQKVTEKTTVLSVEPKTVKKTGEEMIFVRVEKKYYNRRGIAVVDRRNWVFRKALAAPVASASSASPPEPIPSEPASSATTSWERTHVRTLRQTAVTLFRFSALTFNPHKIHYSAQWAKDVEGHKDLVVHGPLNLISILDLWRDTRKPSSLDDDGLVLPKMIFYRATSPLYVEDEYSVVLDDEVGDGIARVRILGPDQKLAMQAEVYDYERRSLS